MKIDKTQRKRFREQERYAPSSAFKQQNYLKVVEPTEQETNALVPYSPKQETPKEKTEIGVATDWPLTILAYGLELAALATNAVFAFSKAIDPVHQLIWVAAGVFAEAGSFFLPARSLKLWRLKCRSLSIFTAVLFVPCFAFAIHNSIGVASMDKATIAETKSQQSSEVKTAEVTASLQQRQLDTITEARKAECSTGRPGSQRGPKCLELEAREQEAIADAKKENINVSVAKDTAKANADTQAMWTTKLVAWISRDNIKPSIDDSANFSVVLIMVVLHLGGLIRMVASKR